ncbi:MAG: hypothetical protein XXXJIFNMEKO3_00145 [Candidatus Erwinia impunctatus]|nr:hypothetical protein XXXJIFNMEKO_00145 [Culicoides impunctatus]
MMLWWKTFSKTLAGMLARPMWMMLLLSLCLMSTIYLYHSVWNLPVAVIDYDHSPASQRLIRSLDATPKIATVIYDDLYQAKRDMGYRQLFAIIIIPEDFEKKVLAGKSVTVPVYGDATNRLANGQIQQDVVAVYQQLLQHYETLLMLKSGFSERQASVILTRISCADRATV